MSHAPAIPDSTAVRTALWRALHLEVDAPPHVLDDRIGLQLAAPDPDWRQRPDMNEYATPGVRASIVARARFIEDLVVEQADHGVGQYVLLGAGLDTFAQRRPEIASRITVFEVDQPGPQAWKRQRLVDLGFGVPEWLRLVPVDFETTSWWDGLLANGFDANKPAVVASLGVSMYLTREATAATLRQSASLAQGSTIAMTFMQPVDLVDSEEQAMHRATDAAARALGHAVHQLLRAGRNPCDGPRCRLRDCASRDGRRLYAALLRRSHRWPSAVHHRRAVGGDDLTAMWPTTAHESGYGASARSV